MPGLRLGLLPLRLDHLLLQIVHVLAICDRGELSYRTATSEEALASFDRPFAGPSRALLVVTQLLYLAANPLPAATRWGKQARRSFLKKRTKKLLQFENSAVGSF
jgi:hypothetical protein